ncbi:MAG: protein-L-isoaspartate(D-aspartate) O-methyltransferase [Bacteroidota bacterium]
MPVDSYKHKGQRRALVQILKEKGIKDENVLNAILKVPRHFFFEKAFEEHAYQDKAFPIGEGQTISQPYTVAFQSELLEVEPGHKVLEIGTGSGYQACVLCELQAKVYTIEYNKILYKKTKSFLPQMGYYPLFFQGDGSRGLPKLAPFDRIIVTAGAPSLPNALIGQLAEQGKLVIPVGDGKRQNMIRITKEKGNRIVKEAFDYFSFVPLKGEFGWQ